MPQHLSNTVETPQRDYATTLQELREGMPIFGRITGRTDDFIDVEKDIPFNIRSPFKVAKAMCRLEPGIYTLHTGDDHDIEINFRIDDPNKQAEVAADFFEQPSRETKDEDYYSNRILRLEGELHDADRKIRQQVDEIMNLKRELAEDKTTTLLTHQKELADLKESHRNEIDRLKEMHRSNLKALEKELAELEKLKFRMEMEQRAGGRDAGSRMLDMLEENAPLFFSVISGLFAQRAGSQGQLTPEQTEAFKAAVAQKIQSQNKSDLPQHDALLNDEAEQPKGAGEETPRHLPADGADIPETLLDGAGGPTLNGSFSSPEAGGHPESPMTI
ncbi:hypothetical protein NC796_01945 [Aliifodinibius sp. S!AR15-10]|uniref:hypothetical protein n=1 Tax=Aliifodinibius sp. S!AR15-10 TaxID=2950437 RepID=UPI00286652CC|nr:hypothetical protein [Aliifodinibius sp. S!AR15-10]MDR8389881.1 hypothetical protein [Aliifodinibius sp. S!AR15-10]